MSITLEQIHPLAASASARLRDELRQLLGDNLVALWAYGAAVFPEPPVKLGDVDTHAVLAEPVDPATAAAIDAIHERIEHDIAETDSWYVLLDDARRPEPHRHAFKPEVIDHAWALHRAHWLAGKCVTLHGREPDDIVVEPTWDDLARALDFEFSAIDEFLGAAWAAHYCIWNCCRIAYSFETKDVVVSKRDASRWALDHMPEEWHEAIRAAGRCYDGAEHDGDRELLRDAVPDFRAYCQRRVGR